MGRVRLRRRQTVRSYVPCSCPPRVRSNINQSNSKSSSIRWPTHKGSCTGRIRQPVDDGVIIRSKEPARVSSASEPIGVRALSIWQPLDDVGRSGSDRANNNALGLQLTYARCSYTVPPHCLSSYAAVTPLHPTPKLPAAPVSLSTQLCTHGAVQHNNRQDGTGIQTQGCLIPQPEEWRQARGRGGRSRGRKTASTQGARQSSRNKCELHALRRPPEVGCPYAGGPIDLPMAWR
jgi:hypothetical protein